MMIELLPGAIARAWDVVAQECPARASADAHRLDEAPLVHTRSIVGAVQCEPGARNHEVGGRCYLPTRGLLWAERTTDAYRLAELLGRAS